jgi:hypothetical protein
VTVPFDQPPRSVGDSCVEFRAYPKTPRWDSDWTITEKIDGTNAGVIVSDDGVYAQSRNRIIWPSDDNHGFAAWVAEHAEELRGLGNGTHFGEWWGSGIQRGYGLGTKGVVDRRFSLFNTSRWADNEDRPACCHVVPIVDVRSEGWGWDVDWGIDSRVANAVEVLVKFGSLAEPGYMRPEGLVLFHHRSGQTFKVVIDK